MNMEKVPSSKKVIIYMPNTNSYVIEKRKGEEVGCWAEKFVHRVSTWQKSKWQKFHIYIYYAGYKSLTLQLTKGGKFESSSKCTARFIVSILILTYGKSIPGVITRKSRHTKH